MMQSLLSSRFKLSIRAEVRNVPVFALILSKPGKTGPQLQPHPSDKPCSAAPADGPDGIFPATCGGIGEMAPAAPGNFRAGARNVTMDMIAAFLAGRGELDRPVLDRTGLTGRLDFSLEWAPDTNVLSPTGADALPAPQGASLLEALKEQLGLKLERTNGPSETLLIDHIEQPSEN